jgi:hypothetical protein
LDLLFITYLFIKVNCVCNQGGFNADDSLKMFFRMKSFVESQFSCGEAGQDIGEVLTIFAEQIIGSMKFSNGFCQFIHLLVGDYSFAFMAVTIIIVIDRDIPDDDIGFISDK